MIAVDTNILVYATRQEFPQHQIAYELLVDLAEGNSLWAITWPSIYEFSRVLTHHNLVNPPASTNEIFLIIESLLKSPSLRVLSHGTNHQQTMLAETKNTFAKGNFFFDLQIASILKEHGVKEIITADSDFLKFSWLKVTNPFL